MRAFLTALLLCACLPGGLSVNCFQCDNYNLRWHSFNPDCGNATYVGKSFPCNKCEHCYTTIWGDGLVERWSVDPVDQRLNQADERGCLYGDDTVTCYCRGNNCNRDLCLESCPDINFQFPDYVHADLLSDSDIDGDKTVIAVPQEKYDTPEDSIEDILYEIDIDDDKTVIAEAVEKYDTPEESIGNSNSHVNNVESDSTTEYSWWG